MGDCKLDIDWILEPINPEIPALGDRVDTSGAARKWLDVPYGTKSPSQVLDIFLPEEGDGPFPVYVFVHGGAFMFGDKGDVQFLHAIDGINRGYAVVSVNYRLVPELLMPGAIYDVKAAIRFLRAHAAEYLLDADRIAIGGNSAGAYYASFVAATQDLPGFDGPEPDNAGFSSAVGALVAQCGLYDALALAAPPEVEAAAPQAGPGEIPVNLMTLSIGANAWTIAEAVRLLSPSLYVTAAFPKTLVQVGSADQIVPCTESSSFYDVIVERCGEGRAELDVFEGWNHSATNVVLSEGWFMKANQDRVFGFLDEAL